MKYNINLEYKYKRKVWINMSDTAEILRLRVLLAFLQLDRESYIDKTAGTNGKRNRGSGTDQILHGSVCLKMKCSVGFMHMPESTAIFTVLI